MSILRKFWYLTKFILAKKNYKYFIGCFYNDYKVQPLHNVPKTSAYVKSYDEQTKWTYLRLKMTTY